MEYSERAEYQLRANSTPISFFGTKIVFFTGLIGIPFAISYRSSGDLSPRITF